MEYQFIVSLVDLPEWVTGSVTAHQSFEELDDAMDLVDELNKDCEDDDHWYEVIVNRVVTR